jgi:hypothetical protein
MQPGRLSPISWFLLLLLAAGCSENHRPAPSSNADGLKELVDVYKYLEYSSTPPPQRVDELNSYVDSLPNALPRIQNGEYLLVWGVGLAAAPPQSGGVLAYEKKAPTEGGAVLLRDGTVKEMTAAEFAAASQIR